jgi:hypothetical protein
VRVENEQRAEAILPRHPGRPETGDLIAAGYSSNYGARKQASWVYLTGTLDAAIRGAELAVGGGRHANQTGDRISKSQVSPTRLQAESVRSRVLSWKIQLQKRFQRMWRSGHLLFGRSVS